MGTHRANYPQIMDMSHKTHHFLSHHQWFWGKAGRTKTCKPPKQHSCGIIQNCNRLEGWKMHWTYPGMRLYQVWGPSVHARVCQTCTKKFKHTLTAKPQHHHIPMCPQTTDNEYNMLYRPTGPCSLTSNKQNSSKKWWEHFYIMQGQLTAQCWQHSVQSPQNNQCQEPQQWRYKTHFGVCSYKQRSCINIQSKQHGIGLPQQCLIFKQSGHFFMPSNTTFPANKESMTQCR